LLLDVLRGKGGEDWGRGKGCETRRRRRRRRVEMRGLSKYRREGELRVVELPVAPVYASLQICSLSCYRVTAKYSVGGSSKDASRVRPFVGEIVSVGTDSSKPGLLRTSSLFSS
jgi:hypothetical protein